MVSSAVEPIARRKLSDEVFDRLKRMITSGDVKPGEAMPSERELMERFGVGRPAIREAMQALSNLGLLTISHGERARVLALTARTLTQQVDTAAQIMLATSPGSLESLKEARVFFEQGMARQAATKATRADIVQLARLVAMQREALGADPAEFIQIDMQFHAAIAAISGNPIYAAVSEAMLGWLKRYHTEVLHWSGKEKITLSEHEAIVAAIETGDADAAEQAMVNHLNRSASLYSHASEERRPRKLRSSRRSPHASYRLSASGPGGDA